MPKHLKPGTRCERVHDGVIVFRQSHGYSVKAQTKKALVSPM